MEALLLQAFQEPYRSSEIALLSGWQLPLPGRYAKFHLRTFRNDACLPQGLLIPFLFVSGPITRVKS